MKPFPHQASDKALIAVVDQWAALMEIEDYQAALEFIERAPGTEWSPDLMKDIVKSYGDGLPTQKVTVEGKPTDVKQRKEVDRWEPNPQNVIGEIWYDLNIDGYASDLTATFCICRVENGIILRLDDIHVM